MSANYQSVRSQIDELDNGDKIRLLSELFDGKLPGYTFHPAQDDLKVVRRHGIGEHGDRKMLGQFGDPILDPFAPVLEALPAESIPPAEKGVPDAAADAMVEAGLLVADQLAERIGHGISLNQRNSAVKSRIVAR